MNQINQLVNSVTSLEEKRVILRHLYSIIFNIEEHVELDDEISQQELEPRLTKQIEITQQSARLAVVMQSYKDDEMLFHQLTEIQDQINSAQQKSSVLKDSNDLLSAVNLAQKILQSEKTREQLTRYLGLISLYIISQDEKDKIFAEQARLIYLAIEQCQQMNYKVLADKTEDLLLHTIKLYQQAETAEERQEYIDVLIWTYGMMHGNYDQALLNKYQKYVMNEAEGHPRRGLGILMTFFVIALAVASVLAIIGTFGAAALVVAGAVGAGVSATAGGGMTIAC